MATIIEDYVSLETAKLLRENFELFVNYMKGE